MRDKIEGYLTLLAIMIVVGVFMYFMNYLIDGMVR